MARTTEEEVRAVIDTDSSIDVLLFIEAATAITDKVEACAEDRDRDLTSSQLKLIETYLAAHFYAARDPEYKSKRTERAAASFFGKDDKWLELAKLIDTSGCLDAMGRGSMAQMYWLGKPPSEQIDYEDRD